MGIVARIALVVNLAKATWAIFGWFGTSSSVIGIVVATWGAVEAEALGIPWPLAMMAGFCVLVAAAYLALVPMAFRLVRNAVPPPFIDHASWAGHSEYRMTDAACLFAGVQTVDCVLPKHPAWGWYSAIYDAIREGEISANVATSQDGRPKPQGYEPLSADSLRAFAEKRNVHPPFLFPD